jgi:Ca2+-transporting ATPase
VAKEASDMILMDDNFKTIIQAVKQGRVIFDNIQKFIHYLLSCNLSEILLIFAAIVLGFPVPLVAIQILWLNVVTGVFPAFSLAFETPEERTMVDPPREPGKPIITNNYKYRIVVQALVLSLGPLLAYGYILNFTDESLEVARTIGFMSLALVHMLHVFNTRKQDGLGIEKSMFKNPYLWGALLITISLQLFAIYTPFMQNVLNVEALGFTLWGYVALFGAAPIVLLQLIAFIRMQIGKPYQE